MAPSPLNMLDAESKRIARRRVEELRRNPPKVTQADIEGADRLFKEHQDFEAAKDRDIERERKALAKDVGSFAYNQISGVGQLFHGIGEGKVNKIKCQFPGCGAHEGEMYNMKDGKWYCGHHKSFGNLTKEQKQKELEPCLRM